MSCRICGRHSCTESFHTIEEQERFTCKNCAYVGQDTLQYRGYCFQCACDKGIEKNPYE